MRIQKESTKKKQTVKVEICDLFGLRSYQLSPHRNLKLVIHLLISINFQVTIDFPAF